MSDNWIQFVPVDPEAQPTREAADKAIELLSSFAPEADEVSAKFAETIEFFHPGGNWSGVECPSCGVDAASWWNDAMDRASQDSFRDLSVTTPCCETQTSLNDLRYVWPATFGRFVLEAMNPNIGNTTPEQDLELTECLGLGLRKVLTRL